MNKSFLVSLFLIVGTALAVTEVEQFEAQANLDKLRKTLAESIALKNASDNEKGSSSRVGANIKNDGDLSAKNEHKKMQGEAFVKTIEQLLPMNPQQVRKLKEVYEESQAAMASPALIPAKPTSSSLLVDLSPNATPPIIRLGSGYISSLVFLDATGQPWPIDSYSLGDPVSFNIRWNQKGNTLLIQSLTFYKSSNLAVILKGLNTPVMITLVSGQDAIDYRVDLRMPSNGPNASAIYGGVETLPTNKVLLEILNGVPPERAKKILVKGGAAQAWKVDKDFYLRTNLMLISPAWKAMIKSADGMFAYQMQPTTVVLASHDGEDKTITLVLDEE